MNLSDLPTYQENDIEQLKSKVEDFCKQYTITKFETDDIIELIEDGEDVSWIIEQLKTVFKKYTIYILLM